MSAIAFLAGILSTLSPCVLPLLPIVLGSASSEHRLGPLALAGGLALSFTLVGLFVATVGFSIGLDGDVIRAVGGFVLLLAGLALALPVVGSRVALAAGPASGYIQQRFGRFDTGGLGGQFGLGVLLGAVWSPCVGPTLGAVSVMAARGENLWEVAATTAMFGIGAAVPLILLGLLSRERMLALRGRLLAAGHGGKAILGWGLVLVGALVATGTDKALETALLGAVPDWLLRLSTLY